MRGVCGSCRTALLVWAMIMAAGGSPLTGKRPKYRPQRYFRRGPLELGSMVVGFFGALPPPLFGPLGGCDPIYVRDAASPATARALLDGVPTCSHVSLSPFGTLPRRTGACPACSGALALGAVCPPVVRLSGRQQLGKGDGHEPFASWVERQASSPWDKAKIPIAKVFSTWSPGARVDGGGVLRSAAAAALRALGGRCDPIYVRDAASPATARVLLDGVPTCSHVSLGAVDTLPRSLRGRGTPWRSAQRDPPAASGASVRRQPVGTR